MARDCTTCRWHRYAQPQYACAYEGALAAEVWAWGERYQDWRDDMGWYVRQGAPPCPGWRGERDVGGRQERLW